MSQKWRNPVKEDAEYVMNNNTEVDVIRDSIPEFCEFLTQEFEFETADWDAPVFPNLDDCSVEDVVDFLFVGNALNYCFNDMESGDKFQVEFIGSDWTGAFGMWAALMKEYQRNPDVLSGDHLAQIDQDEVERIFESSNDVQIPMIQTRVENLNSVGQLMNEYDGTFWDWFSDGQVKLYGSSGLVSNLSYTSAFRDSRTYDDQTVRFDKRAQLAVSMVYGKLLDTEYEFNIVDMDSFSVFADYGIPAGLATHGVIEYSDDLYNDIESGVEIEENSKEEIEIRAATVVAVQLVSNYLEQNYDVKTDMPVLDFVLWNMRRDAKVNVHLTETTAY